MDRGEFKNRLFAAWACFPHLRFGQFIEAITAFANPYYMHDEELLALAEKYVANATGAKWTDVT